jgi:hypothetical protein
LALWTAQGVEELVEVDRRGRVDFGDRLVVLELGRVVGPRLDRDVAVGDPGERGRADDRGAALVERAVDRDVDLRLPVVGQLDVVDAADRGASDQNLVALDQLSARFKDQAVVVGVAAAREEQDDDRDRDQDEGGDPGDAAEPAAPSYTSFRSGPYDGPFIQQLLTCVSAAFLSCRVQQLRSDPI